MGGPLTASRRLLNARRALGAMTLVALVLLSGCAGKASKATIVDPNMSQPAQYDEDSGGIEGVVLSDEQVPLAGASVGIVDLGISGVSDAAGRYSLSDVPPGPQNVQVAMLGYESKSQAVNVVAGEAVRGVDFVLLKVAISAPSHETLDRSGFFGCGSSWRPAVVFSGVSACGIVSIGGDLTGQDTSSFDKFQLNWTLPYPTGDWSGAVFEMTWASTQATGRGLSMVWEIDGCVNAAKGEGRFLSVSGVSPLRVWMSKEQIQSVLNLDDPTCADSVGDEVAKVCSADGCTLISRVFSDSATAGDDSPADVGVTVQQPFHQYVTAFYGEPPADAESFTAIQG